MRRGNCAIFAMALGTGLSGCGGGTSVGGFGTGTLASQLSYASGPSDTVPASLVQSKGIAGVVAVAPGIGTEAGLQSIKVRASGDYQTVYVSINGGSEFALAATFPSDSNGGGYGTTGLNANYVGLTNLPNYSLIARTKESSGGFGYAGIATQPADLPGSMTYSGTWTGYLNPNTASLSATFGTGGGDMDLVLDVAGMNMDGTFSGSMNIGSGGSSTVYPISGTVDTTLSGSIFSGSFAATTGTYKGSSDLAGVFFGDAAETAAGAIAGSLSGPSGKHAFYGIFNLD